MGVLHATDLVAVATEKGRPTSLMWRGRRYLITDTPTPLHGDEVLHDAITHPLVRLVGWRFQVTSTSDPDDVLVVDVHRHDGGRWELVAAYK